MRILVDHTGTVEGLAALLDELVTDTRIGSILILAADGNDWRAETVDPILTACSRPLFGGLFPQILYGGERWVRGIIAVGLAAPAKIAVLEHLDDLAELEATVARVFPVQAATRHTLFAFVDGLAPHIGNLVEVLYDHFGLELNTLGGGAGSMSLRPKPCLLTPDGLRGDAALLALTQLCSSVGVAHGWAPISGAFKITESRGNCLLSLDWRPAFDVYREIVEQHSGQSFDGQPFHEIAKAYPFGIAKLDAEMVVRDPIAREDGALLCVGEVPQGAYVHILNGNTESLIAAAVRAHELASGDDDPRPAEVLLFIDCISRALFLGDAFQRELEIVREPTLPLIGALTFGEIANSGRDYLEYYNKTAVVAFIRE